MKQLIKNDIRLNNTDMLFAEVSVICILYTYAACSVPHQHLGVHCTSLTKRLTWELTIWLSLDMLQETLTLG